MKQNMTYNKYNFIPLDIEDGISDSIVDLIKIIVGCLLTLVQIKGDEKKLKFDINGDDGGYTRIVVPGFKILPKDGETKSWSTGSANKIISGEGGAATTIKIYHLVWNSSRVINRITKTSESKKQI